eukprot:1144444-Pelagomonas_calceolata.AAC.1
MGWITELLRLIAGTTGCQGEYFSVLVAPCEVAEPVRSKFERLYKAVEAHFSHRCVSVRGWVWTKVRVVE